MANYSFQLNPYKIHHAIFVDDNNVKDFNKSIHSVSKQSLLEKLKGIEGKFYIITEKQFGLIQNRWSHNVEFSPNTKLSVHFLVKDKYGCESLIPMTKKQFENPVIQ